jgi:hypothetical protein
VRRFIAVVDAERGRERKRVCSKEDTFALVRHRECVHIEQEKRRGHGSERGVP